METVNITIDGQQYEVEKGIPLVLAAERAGVRIPHLCFYEGLSVFAGCRLCVVQIDGVRGLPTSCSTQTTEGQVVWTKTPEIVEMQRGVMSLILADHPDRCLSCHRQEHCGIDGVCLRDSVVTYRCLTCAKNKRCEFQSTSEEMEMQKYSMLYYQEAHSWYGPDHVELPIKRDNPFIELDFNECILCARCVRACDETRGLSVYEMSNKGPEARIDTAFSLPMQSVGCDACGACIDVCPVACILDRPSKWKGNAQRTVTTVCPHCSDGCQLDVEVKQDKVLRVSPNKEAPANHGIACAQGRFGLDFINDQRRLTKPLIRRDGHLTEASWEEALDLVAARLMTYKSGSFAALASPSATNEENYLLQKLTREAMASPYIETYTATDDRGLFNALAQSMGYPASTGSLDSIYQAKCLLVMGDVTFTHPIAAWQTRRAGRFTSATVIVASPRESELTTTADIWLRYKPGTELALLGGLLKVILDEGLTDQSFLAERCTDLDALQSALEQYSLPTVAETTGVAAEAIQRAARAYAGSGASTILYEQGLLQFTQNKEAAAALVDLALLTGNVGKEGAGVMAMGSAANLQGSWDMGCHPAYLPGYRPAVTPGLPQPELLDAISSRRIRAAILAGVDPAADDPNRGDATVALENLDFLVVMDSTRTATAEKAHVVLPLSTFAEQDGSFTNGERRVQRVRQVFTPREGSMPGWEIMMELGHRMGEDGFHFEGASAIFDEIARSIPLYTGLSHDRLEQESPQWPCPSADHPGTPALYTEQFRSGKARLLPVSAPSAPEPVSSDYPLLLAVGREMLPYHREVLTAKEDPHTRPFDEELLRIHPDDAARWQIDNGDALRVITRGATVQAMASVTDGVPSGSAFLVLPVLHNTAVVEQGPIAELWESLPQPGVMAARLEKA